MKFDLDEQQIAFQQGVADYLAAECPVSRALEPHDHGKPDFALWRGLMQLGIGGIVVPEEHGGLGLGLLDLAVVMEPIGRHAAPGPFLDHALGTLALTVAGTDAQKAEWLPALATGEKRATVALAEGKGEWFADQWTMEAKPTLTGEKHHVLHAEGTDAIIVGLAGGRLALVRGDAPGLSVTPTLSTDAGRQLCTVAFADTPCEPLEGAAGARLVDAGLVLLAADAFGGASRAVDMSVAYAKEREQFGRPIGAFQGLKHQLADMAVTIEPAVGLYWFAAHVWDTDPAAAPLQAALAKSLITENYARATRRMTEAHGGIGYTWEYGAHVWLKRALFDQAYIGMPRALRARVADLSGW
ncbi:MAG: acyl-CoA/acyl-ACP dehydrogenase [Novosphingobium sp.]|nr:acyl-CoA/acyl-ACP dehydrogenase [Novosphingobium sp.]